MTTPQTPPAAETSTAVAVKGDVVEQKLLEKAQTFEERQQAFQLADQVRQASMIRKAVEALAAESWGKGINPVARAAVARYCFEIGADPVRHVFVLGGNIYLNAECYRELVAADPDFDHDEWEFIHQDPRRTETEQARCRALRLQYGVPEETVGACLVRLHFKNRGAPIIGCNWVKMGTHPNGNPRDPVGLAHPTQTAHSRAYRKAAMKACPAWFKKHEKLTAAEEIITKGRALEALPPPAPEPAAAAPGSTPAPESSAQGGTAGDPPPTSGEPSPNTVQADLALDADLQRQDP